MAPKIYEIKVFREGRELRDSDINPFLTGLDLSEREAEKTADLLNRHLLGAVRRSGARRDDVHLFHMEVRDINHEGKGAGRPLFRWVLPVPAEDER